MDDITDFIELVKLTITDKVGQAIADGSVEVFIGFEEKTVNDTPGGYDKQIVTPYVHLRQTT